LESVCWGNSTVGSNPTLSAILIFPFFMGGTQTFYNLRAELKDFFVSQRSASQLLTHCYASHQFHCEEVHAILTCELLYCLDVGVIQFGESESFFTEPFSSSFVGQHSRRKNF
jgi:hypothetical protein